MAEVQIKKLSWWHNRIIDWLIANPDKFLKDCAVEFNVTQSWLSTIKNSDCFKEAFDKRSAELSGRVVESLTTKTMALTEVAIDALTEKVEKEHAAGLIGRPELMAIAEMGLSKLGYGVKTPVVGNVTNVNVEKVVVNQNTLVEARERMMALSKGKPASEMLNPTPMLEAVVEEVA